MSKLESVVIVHNPLGSVATIRFSNYKNDKILSVTGRTEKAKNTLYALIEQHVQGVLNA